MSSEPSEVAHLVSALLSVNGYPLDRACALMPAFGERGLLDAARVGAMPQAEVISAMIASGYRRGGFVPILSFRLYLLMEAVAAGALAGLGGMAAAGRKTEFVATLSAVSGFGPTTAELAWGLFREG